MFSKNNTLLQPDTITTPVIDTTISTGVINDSLPAREVTQIKAENTVEAPLANFLNTSYTPGMQPRWSKSYPDAWILPLLLGTFFIAALISTYYLKELRTIFTGTFRKDGLRKLAGDDNFMVRRTLLMLMLLFFLILPVFAYQVAEMYQLKASFLPIIPAYFQLLLLIAGIFGLKLLVIQFLGFLFRCRNEAMIYSTGMMVNYSFAGMLFIPVSLGIKLSPPFISEGFMIAGIVIIAVSYCFSVLTGIMSGLRSNIISKFHLILYLCALEILPLILIAKAIKNIV